MSVPADAMSIISDREFGLEVIDEFDEIALQIEKEKALPPLPQRSLARAIGIVATCTGAMVVNVRISTLLGLIAR